MIESEFDMDGFRALLLLIILSFSCLLESSLFVFLGFGRVLAEEFEELTGLVFVNRVLEYIKRRRHLESLQQYPLLSLNSNVLWPFHKPSQISLRLDVSSDSEVSGIL